MPDILHRVTATEAAQGGERLKFVLSDEAKDRYGDIIKSDGWQLANFKKNPIAMFNHDRHFPVGVWESVKVEGRKLVGTLKLAAKGTSARLDEVISLVDQGIIRAVSVGFRALARTPMLDDEGNPTGGLIFSSSELLEASLVSVPANPGALQLARSLQISDATLSLVFGEEAVRRQALVPDRPTAEQGATSQDKRAGGMTTPIGVRIQDAQNTLNAARDAYDTLVSDPNADGDQVDEAEKVFEAAKKALERLQKAERLLGQQTAEERGGLPAVMEQRPPYTGPAVRVPFAQPAAQKLEPADYLIRYMVGLIDVHGNKMRGITLSHDAAIAARYGEGFANDEKTRVIGEWLQRAASAVATTFTSGWASQLVQIVNASFMETLVPDSVYPRLAARGMRVGFGRNGQINIPSRVTTPSLAGAFVLEGNPIPVKQGAFTSVPITPKKMAVITTFTREIAQYSTPAIEALLRDAIREDTSGVLDSTLLDATASSTTRPAGIRNGVSVTAATAGGGLAALVTDVKNLIGALQTGLANQLRSPVWIMNSQQATSISLITTTAGVAVFPFAEQIQAGTFAGYPVIVSNTVTAGMVILIDAADFVSAEGDDPRFEVSDQATLHMEDTTPLAIGTVGSPATVAAPTRSLWQTDSLGLRMIMPVNWILRRTGGVAWTQAVTW
jgi:HK97 family phage prohead protease